MRRRSPGFVGVATIAVAGMLALASCESERSEDHYEVASLWGYDLGPSDEGASMPWYDEPQPAHEYWGYELFKFATGDLSGIEPAACQDLHLATALLTAGDAETASGDLMADIDELWRWDTFNHLALRAREFPTPADANAFLASLPSLVEPCTGGYTLPDHALLPWEMPGAAFETLASPEVGIVSIVRMPSEAWAESVDPMERAEWPQFSYYFAAHGNLVMVLEGTTSEWGSLDAEALAILEGAAAYADGVEGPPMPVVTPALDPEPTPFNGGGMVTVEQISSLELWLVGGEREEPWPEPTTAGEWFESNVDGECLDLRRAEMLLTATDQGNSDVIIDLGGIHVFETQGDQYSLGPQVWVQATARVFATPASAEGFLTDVVDAGEDCRGGFSVGDFGTDGYERSVGSVLLDTGQREGGGDWVTVDLRQEMVWVDDFGVSNEHIYLHYFRYGNVVVQLGNPVGFETTALPAEDRDFLFDQIVSHLQAAG